MPIIYIQVLDPRTRLILFKLLNKGFVSVIDGCLSTGKEVSLPLFPPLLLPFFFFFCFISTIPPFPFLSFPLLPLHGQANVYYSRNPTGEEYAIKVFKTSILVFKDRDRYVSGIIYPPTYLLRLLLAYSFTSSSSSSCSYIIYNKSR